MDIHVPTLGARLSLNGYIGTIRYVGLVESTPGVWIGVEWDDPTRGKHDGSKDGKQYFTCRIKTSGSFIRPTANIQYGISYLDALTSKYVETLHGSGSQEKVILGSSGGVIEVEAVSLDKIRQKFARLDNLREVSLDGANVGCVDTLERIHQTCPNVRGLDLSQNLLQSWSDVAQITKELPLLQRLSLNRNRLHLPPRSDHLAGAFNNLLELHLNNTLITWAELKFIMTFMPKIQAIEIGYNHLSRLPDEVATMNYQVCATLRSLNLDSNSFSDWVHLASVLTECKSLQRLVLTANVIEHIPFPTERQQNLSLSSIEYLSLSDNRIASWPSVDALSIWLPKLMSLSVRGNPFVSSTAVVYIPSTSHLTFEHKDDEKHARSFIIARIPSLVTLDGTKISPRERTDSELYYMSFIIKQGYLSKVTPCQNHYRWPELCQSQLVYVDRIIGAQLTIILPFLEHGKPIEEPKRGTPQNKLRNLLIDLELYPYAGCLQQTRFTPDLSQKIPLRVLPTMSLRILRIKICKILKQDAHRIQLKCWLCMGNGSLSELTKQDDLKDLDCLGFENGSQIVYEIIQ